MSYLVCGAITIQLEATLDTSGKLLNAESIIPFITSMLCLTLATNVLTTCMNSKPCLHYRHLLFLLGSIDRVPYLEDPQQLWKGSTFHA